MYLVDSDFDTEDEAYADDIEEVISNHIVNSVTSEGGGAADLDEDFLAYEENVKIKPVDQKAENEVPLDSETKPDTTPSAQALKNKKKKQKRKAKKDKVAAAKVENTPETNNEPAPNDKGAKNQPAMASQDKEEVVIKVAEGVAEEVDDEDDDLEEEADEDDLNDDVQFEFFKDFTVSKPIPGTKFERERRILAFGNGNKQMTEEMTQFVN